MKVAAATVALTVAVAPSLWAESLGEIAARTRAMRPPDRFHGAAPLCSDTAAVAERDAEIQARGDLNSPHLLCRIAERPLRPVRDMKTPEGLVSFNVLVNERGDAVRARLLAPADEVLAQQARPMAMNFRFIPARKDGSPVEAWLPVTVVTKRR